MLESQNIGYGKLMTKQKLLELLQDIEWDNFEVKTAKTDVPKDVWETVSAFSNTSGGWIVFGVSQKKKVFEIVGVDAPEKLENDVLTTLRSKTKFNIKLSPQAKRYKIDSKNVLAFYIPSSDIKPVYFNGVHNTFIRTGSGDQQASEFEINALYRDQAFGSMSEKTVESTSVNSLNKASYRRFREYLKGFNPNLHYNSMEDDEFNQRLKIITDGKLTYGGLLFLGTNAAITDHFSDFRVDYLEIPATNYADAEPRYTFRVEEQENLWEYYFVLFQRLRIYANNPLTIGEMGIGREDTKEIDALREALVNLLIHTDYFSPMKPRIRVFTNRIEFENPGKLPRTVEELMKTDETLPRNPVLAKFFRMAKLCESAGYGFDKMLQWKKQTGNEVLFETSIDKTKFTFMLDAARANQEGGMINDESGTIDNKSGTINDESGMIDSKSGTINDESGMKSGTIDSESGTINSKSGTINDKGGTINDEGGMKSGTIDSESGTITDESGTINDKSGMISGTKGGTIDSKSGMINDESGMKSGTIDRESGTITDESGTITDESGTIDSESGTINDESGTIDNKSGTIDSESGTINDESGTINSESGTESRIKIKTIDKIMDLIGKNNTISITQLSTATNISRSTIQKHIDNLKSKGIIRREGAGKGGKWVIIDL